ncbi:HesA/MoeB/ThiF family protein [Chryseobacterium gambrini]|uniref:HesA/MoeB/ThiF family protein n=1 Tax=Chryseobacterium gambrini TaxID=373672 RepID=UPI0022F39241|nr:HesA/MoeB/ThiF family protein [Chryseobacterium gambrini]WBX97957.1 HesA/MoeB/ThiF family protein [Chryseobacterium gambrini]
MNIKRYNRQIILPGFGISTQEKLSRSSVLVVGAGGLGCPVMQILVSTGVGVVGVADFDTIELENLHRQYLYSEQDVGVPKVIAAVEHLSKINSEIDIIAFQEMITNKNVLSIIHNFDVVVDCTDNFATRYLLNDACYLMKKPLVYASLFRDEGQVSVFNVEKEDQMTNYRDLFPVPPNQSEVPNCNEAGVLPTHSAVIGTFQANEVIKLLSGSAETLIHQLLIFNTKNYQSMKIKFNENQEKAGPKTIEEFQNFDYEEFCSLNKNDEINSFSELQSFLNHDKSILIDVREEDEQPKISAMKILELPFGTLEENLERLNGYTSICFVCVSGIRSQKAVKLLKSHFPDKEIKHFKSGIKSIVQ